MPKTPRPDCDARPAGERVAPAECFARGSGEYTLTTSVDPVRDGIDHTVGRNVLSKQLHRRSPPRPSTAVASITGPGICRVPRIRRITGSTMGTTR